MTWATATEDTPQEALHTVIFRRLRNRRGLKATAEKWLDAVFLFVNENGEFSGAQDGDVVTLLECW